MATKLTKDLIRETTIKRKDKEVIVTLTKEQSINLRLKGVRGDKGFDIGIDEIYDQVDGPEYGNNKHSQRYPDDLLIPIHDLRSEVLTSNYLTYEEKVKFSNLVRTVIVSTIKRIKQKENE